ncbi:immunoglobulin lambda-1 light chain-like isoform X4 [Oreochromis niloticus]|uniref:immunoglobulin lambda-1 light chain-like isoform X4 n=1 Tax=Oreochromis niloticus TaxID=8128 RepID=UPI000DF29C57|nr:immunoglobulin lambda-1 light chain-like isoform X4 [Oreochromis niloticus]
MLSLSKFQVSTHTDNMLVTLCALITALTCVSGVTVLTQKPVVSVRKGETATMDCNLGIVTNDATRWYKQIPGGVPQFVLRFRYDSSSPSYGSGFSSPKFTSTHQSRSDYRLIIKNVEEGDSAVYYCKTWDSSVKEDVFGQGTKLIVTSSSLSPPVLTVFPPSSAELQSNTASLVCLSSQSVPFADVSWLAGGSPVSSGISTSTAVQRPDQTYQISSSLTIQTSDWNMDKVYTCKVSLGLHTLHKIMKKSECPTE